MKKVSLVCLLVVLSGCDAVSTMNATSTFKDKSGHEETCDVHAYGVVTGVNELYQKCKQDLLDQGYTLVSEKKA